MAVVDTLRVQLLTISVLALQRQIYHNRGLNGTPNNSTYDFVVVGAGTAGSIVASRLSQNRNISVLLIEAGGPLTITSDMMPAYYNFDFNWGYYTTKQRNAAFGLRNRQVFQPRGKILGGSHAINTAIYSRGNPRDYDSWANQHGAIGWSFSDVYPYFLKSENNTDPEVVASNVMYHSTSGPLEVSTVPNPDPILLHWTNAVNMSGWPKVDMNGPSQLGTSIMQTTQSRQNWTRQTTAAAYIEVNVDRPNLHVFTDSMVTRILMKNSSDQVQAYGVQFERNSQIYQIMARKEVIVSGGAINTPQLLMLSGIGPRWHLEQFNIPVVVDLPVGDTLFDHVTTGLDFLVRNQSDVGWSANLSSILNAPNLANFLAHSDGPLTRLPISETYVPTGVNGDKDWPDGLIYALVNQINPDIEVVLQGYDQSNQNAWRKYFEPLVGNNRRFTLAFGPFRTVTSGTVRLASNDPYSHPLIDPNYFANRRDLLALVRTMSVAMKIVESEYMRPYLEYTSVSVPGCALCTDTPMSECFSYLMCVAQMMTTTSFHPVGTCPMGNETSRSAVVDPRLRVRNVSNLRVVDASVMPSIPNSNTNAPTMMIAEMASDFIRQDNRL